jgi:phage shock protein E
MRWYVTLLALIVAGCARAPVPTAAKKRPVRRSSPPSSLSRPLTTYTAQERAAARDTIILDVRTATDYSNQRVAGAQNLDFLSPSFTEDARRLDPRKTYLVYCGSGHLAGKAVRRLRGLGLKADKLGGIAELRERGIPMEGVQR